MAIAGLLMTGGWAVGACSSDDNNSEPGHPNDAGKSDATMTTGGNDSGSNDSGSSCPSAISTGTCTAAACSQMAGGAPATCVDNKCVTLTSPECAHVVGPWQNDNALFLGEIISLIGSDSVNGVARLQSASLAINEINDTTAGSGGVLTASGCAPRPLVLVVCEDSNSPLPNDAGTLNRDTAARHLTSDIKVGGIIGPGSSGDTIDVFQTVSQQALTVLMPMASESVDITTIDGGTQQGARLIWRMVPDDSYQTRAMAEFYNQYVAAKVNKPSSKVAIVYRSDAYGVGGFSQLTGPSPAANLQVDGHSWTDPANAANVLAVEYNAALPVPASAVEQVLAFQPDVIFYFGLGEFSGGFVGPYEDQNNGVTDGGVPEGGTAIGNKPIWVTTTAGQRGDLLNVIAARPSAGLEARVLGTSSLIISPLTQAFYNVRYLTAYPDAGANGLLVGMAGVYDSTYMLAYAMQSENPGYNPISPLNTAKGLAQVVSGATEVDVGPANLKTGLGLLQQGQAIKFNGASGSCNFDPTTGQEPGNYTMFCVRSDPNSGLPVFQNNTGMVWDYMKNQLTGTFSCQ